MGRKYVQIMIANNILCRFKYDIIGKTWIGGVSFTPSTTSFGPNNDFQGQTLGVSQVTEDMHVA
jgi:hypothetical protein